MSSSFFVIQFSSVRTAHHVTASHFSGKSRRTWKLPNSRFEHQTFLLWGDGANSCVSPVLSLCFLRLIRRSFTLAAGVARKSPRKGSKDTSWSDALSEILLRSASKAVLKINSWNHEISMNPVFFKCYWLWHIWLRCECSGTSCVEATLFRCVALILESWL